MNKRIAYLSGAFVFLIGFIVLLGWQFDLALLKTGFPGSLSTMKPNTALGFLLSGLLLGLLQLENKRRKRLKTVIFMVSCAIISIGWLTLIEYFFQWNLGIDEVLFRDINPSATTSYPGRMGVNTALNFVLMGVSLLLSAKNTHTSNWVAQILGTIAAIIALLALLGHLFGVSIFSSLTIYTTTLAPHTAVTFLVLYIGILWTRIDRGLMETVSSPLLGGFTARWLLPWAIIFPIASNWFVLQGFKQGWYNLAFAQVLLMTITILTLSILIWGTARSLNHLESVRQKTQVLLTEKEQRLKLANETLEKRVAERTTKLEEELLKRQQIEEALRESEGRFRNAFDYAAIGMILLDMNGNFLKINRAFSEIVGYSEAELMATTIWAITDPDDLKYDLQAKEQLLNREIPLYQTEKRYIHKQGHIVWVFLNALLVYDRTEQPLFFIGQIQNITIQKQAQKALQQSEEKYRRIVETATEGIWEIDTNNHTTYANRQIAQMLGYTVEEMLGRSLFAFMDEEGRAIAHSKIEHRRQGIHEQHDFKFCRKDGSDLWAIVSTHPIVDEMGQYAGALGMITDITARKQTQEALRLINERLQFLLTANPAVLFTCKPDGDYGTTFMSENAIDILGYEAKKFTEKSSFWHDRVHPKDIERIMAGVPKIFEKGFHEHQYDFLHSDGTYHWIYVQMRVVNDSADNPIEIVGYALDISDRREVEKALQDSEERLQLALEGSGDGLWDWNIPTGEVYLSPRWLTMLEYAEDELPGSLQTWEKLIHPDDKPWVMHRLEAHLQDDNVSYAFDYRLLAKSDQWKWIANYGKVVVRDATGQPLRMTGLHRDISDRKQTELQLQQTKEEAIAASRAKSIFLANMSHELRTPLNAILGFTQLMNLDPSLNPTQQERLSIINRSGEHLLALIDDILAISKIETGRMTLNINCVDLYGLLTSLEEMLQGRAEAKGLKLRFERSLDVPQYVQTDEQKLRQVLINLLGNAIKFTQKGKVRLWIIADESSDKTTILHFTVEDTGVGIAPEEIDRLFDIFVQTDAGRRSNQGTGLGLAISQKFVQLMGGEIRASSQLRQGSIFTFEIPVQLGQPIDRQTTTINRRIIGLEPGQPSCRILIVEDQPDSRRLLVEILNSVGFEVKTAINGVEAIQQWESWSPHLIWMDIKMPIMDGYKTIKWLKSRQKEQKTIIIALTASVFEEERKEILSFGCDDFVRKPFQKKIIFEKMAQHLGVRYCYEGDKLR